ncbi:MULTISPECIES: WD40 domain-containing protein [Nostocales]|uniref:Uncharacterized protein n=3 Tax=Nostocales TaxID=1161 RepID=A0A0C1R2P0_9CYAN|nr:hypothetical protein [Tolypothrix bouteillei]KAF3885987.1 hypothetical protein DA73_0400011275 [Tolypothrix bouteillei VB521301]
MSDLHRLDSNAWEENAIDVSADNESALEELAWGIDASVGRFKLFLARCNYARLRVRLIERLQELTNVEIRILELQESEKTLYARIHKEFGQEQPDVLMVLGLESVTDLEDLLSATNQVREEFRKSFHFPLVLWIDDEVFNKLIRVAPDFESWAISTEFAIATEELVDFLKKTSEQFFEGNLTLNLEARREIKLACHILQNRQQVLDLELRASLESLLGEAEYTDGKIALALKHYQKGLELWQQNHQLNKQVKLLIDIAFCYFVKTPRYREKNHPDLQATRHYIQQCFKIFEQIDNIDLSASSILKFGDMLRDLQNWHQLQTLAQKALQHHQAQDKPIELARDYGFLAEVALAQEAWEDARELAKKALEALLTFKKRSQEISGVVYKLDKSRYLLILAKAQQHLERTEKAIGNLEEARKIGDPEENPCLYLDILSHLQQVYFKQQEYLKAFEIKLERQSIEQQYGFRSFIGAGRIQPQRQAELALRQVETQETVALEIVASGRLLDVRRLTERIGRNDCKLIAIHGESGVGKSSLVNGGLLPALKQKAIGIQDTLPVLMRVYTSWVAELGRLLTEALEKKGIQLTTSLDSTAAILAQIRRLESCNLRTVLIFDQFEEFFFVYHGVAERRQFFEFLGECFQILPVKVILSLREDYLHYLLECNRLPCMAIIGNDILSKNVLYPLGNFLPADATAIIEQLTDRSNFHLEPALIEELVKDLADKLGEVRPIELQVVGAQLQTENITTLVQYRDRGPKNELVKRYLAQVVSDCGAENKETAELVLYLMTDEKGTRPLKTRAEVERDLQVLVTDFTAEASKLDLVLKIFVDSGLVVLLPELPDDRYQLVHDYLAALIRQQQEPRLKELIAELEKERKQRHKAEDQRKQAEVALARVEQHRQSLEAKVQQVRKDLADSEAERDKVKQEVQEAQIKLKEAEAAREEALIGTELELAGLRALRKFEFSQIDALLTAMEAGKQLKARVQDGRSFEKYPALSPLLALQQILDNIQEKNRLQGHQDEVRSVSFSPDGQTLASASSDRTARLWNLQGSQLIEFQGHEGHINTVCFSPDGQYLATASNDRTARLWNLQGSQLAEFKGHERCVNSVCFSPDGQTLATASDDNTARLWDLQGNQLVKFKGHQHKVNSVCFSPDGQILATASNDCTALLWNLQGKPLLKLEGHQRHINSICFSRDGQTLATASDDRTARLWDLQGNCLVEFKGHQGKVRSVSFSPDGQTLATGSSDGTARLWNLHGYQVQKFRGNDGWVWSVSFSPDGQTLATASADVRLWNVQGKQQVEFRGHRGDVNSISFHINGQYLATGSGDGTAKLWNLQGKQLKEFRGHKDRVRGVSFSPDGQYLATSSFDGTAKLWDLQRLQLVEFKGHQHRVNSVSFSPNGQYLVTASVDGTARVWNLLGKQLVELENRGIVWSVSCSPNGQHLATASENGIVRLWNLQGKQLGEFQAHHRRINCVNFSLNGQQLATASSDGNARLWDLQGNQLAEFKGHQGWVSSVCFSPDGQTLATGSSDGTARIWDLQGNQLAEFKGHQRRVTCVSFSPNGQYLATASDDGTAKLWRVENLEQLLARGSDWLRDYSIANQSINK